MKSIDLKIGDDIIVILKEQGYFDPRDISREVKIYSKDQMEKNLLKLNSPEGWSKNYKNRLYNEMGLMRINSFAGMYVGDRENVIKVRPLYGLESPESDYFIIPKDQIKEIKNLQV